MTQPQADGASLAPRDPAQPFAVVATPEPPGLVDPTRPLAGQDADAAVAPSSRPAKQIATLPPLDELQRAQLPLSAQTGQPRRSIVMVLGILFLYAAGLLAAVALAHAWWLAIHVGSFAHSSALVRLWHPRPGGWRSIVAVTLVTLIGASTTAAPAIAGFNAWNGHRWSRVAAVLATLWCLLSLLVGPWAWGVPALAAVGAAVLWLPPVTRYFEHWRRFRAGTPVPHRDDDEPVVYGPLPRYL